MRVLLPLVVLLTPFSGSFAQSFSYADDVHTEIVRVAAQRDSPGPVRVIINVTWSRAWHNDRNHDAAWVFLKYLSPDGGYRHAALASEGHEIVSGEGILNVVEEGTGAFVVPAGGHLGRADFRLALVLDRSGLSALEDGFRLGVFAVEMVYVPEGPFTLGDPLPEALAYGAYYRSDSQGQPAGLFRVEGRDEIPVGPREGALYYQEATYHGDRSGPVPSTFPNGFGAFYTMKHELSQGQYAAFLNTLADAGPRAEMTVNDHTRDRGTLTATPEGFVAYSPDYPLNFSSWDDGLAWAAWAGLRPMTDLEFTKAARGGREPGARSFPWGTDSIDNIQFDGFAGPVVELEPGAPSDKTGASNYGVMRLAGGVWERVVTISRADGREFLGSPGSGSLSPEGNALNEDWPHTWAGREGHGYRGGGFYGPGTPAYEFNPYSPIAFRRFGGWSGPDRHRAYGFRAARTAEN